MLRKRAIRLIHHQHLRTARKCPKTQDVDGNPPSIGWENPRSLELVHNGTMPETNVVSAIFRMQIDIKKVAAV